MSRYLCRFIISLEGIIFPVSVSAMPGITRFIFTRYIYYWSLRLINNVIINKTKVLFHQTEVTLDDFVILFRSFDLLAPNYF